MKREVLNIVLLCLKRALYSGLVRVIPLRRHLEEDSAHGVDAKELVIREALMHT
jgi:hypothetical protein